MGKVKAPSMGTQKKEGTSPGLQQSLICDEHFELGDNKDAHTVILNRWLGLDRRTNLRAKKGIQVHAGQSFTVSPVEGNMFHISEFGVKASHAVTLRNNIVIYVKYKNEKLVIGKLSSGCGRLSCRLFFSGEFELSHSSIRKTVFFNGYELPLIQKSVPLPKTKREFWGAQVEPQQECGFSPSEELKKYHLSQVVLSEEIKDEEKIHVFVQYNEKRIQVATLSSECASSFCDLEFDYDFSLSHTSSSVIVNFFGYMVPLKISFELEDLDVPDNNFAPRPPKKC